jgi:hypothetical protein
MQGNFTFPAEMIVALIEFLTAVWLSLYMGWAVHSLRLIPRFTNTLLACCGKRYQDVYYEDDHEDDRAAKSIDEHSGNVSWLLCSLSVFMCLSVEMLQLSSDTNCCGEQV